MSNRLTFSLASLTLLIALGLVFVATPAMAVTFPDGFSVDDQTWVQGEKIKEITLPTATASANAGTLTPAISIDDGETYANLQGETGTLTGDSPLIGLTYTLTRDDGADKQNTLVVKLTGRASNVERGRKSIRYRVSESGSPAPTPAVVIFTAVVGKAPTLMFSAGTDISDKKIVEGDAKSYVLPAAIGGVGPLRYSIDGTAETSSNSGIWAGPPLPSGMTFTEATRLLAGIPTADAARRAVTYRVTDSAGVDVDGVENNTEFLTFTIEVTARPTGPKFDKKVDDAKYTKGHAITAMTLPAATTTYATAPVTYTLTGEDATDTDPKLPKGLSFDATDLELTGTPGAAGEFPLTYTATDAADRSALLRFKITVADEVKVIVPDTGLTHVRGKAPSYSLTIPTPTGGTDPPPQTVVTGLPDELTFDKMKITGDPVAVGPITVTITATDELGASDTADFTITVNAAPNLSFDDVVVPQTYEVGKTITPMLLPRGEGGVGMSHTYAIDTATPLPAGISFDPKTRLLSGTPTEASAAAVYNYVISDSAFSHVKTPTADQVPNTVTLPITLTVRAETPNSAPDFGDATIPNIDATVNTPISGMFLPEATDTDSGDTLTYSVSPSPTAIGLVFNPANRSLTGTPNAIMPQTPYTYKVDDGNGGEDTIGFFITVTGPVVTPPTDPVELRFVDASGAVVTSLAPLTLTAGTAIGTTAMPYIQLPSAIGGVGDITYSLRKGLGEVDVTSGDNGLMVDLTELRLQGTPTAAAASMQYQWRATDARGEGDAKGVKKLNFIITVNPGPAALTVTISTSAPTVRVKDNFTVAFTTSNNVTNVAAVLDTASVAAGYTISSATPTAATGVTIMQAKSKVAGQATPAADVTLTLTPSGSSGAGTPATITVPFAERPFNATDWDKAGPTVVIGDVADDQNDDFEVRFNIRDNGNASGVTQASGFKVDESKANKPIVIGKDSLEATIIDNRDVKAAIIIKGPTEAIPQRITDKVTGDVIFASFAMTVSPRDPDSRVPIIIRVTATDRAGNAGVHEISVTLGPRDPFLPTVRAHPNIISCLTGSMITVTFPRQLAAGQALMESDVILSDPDSPNPVVDNGWRIVDGTFTFANSSTPTATFKVMPKSDRSWLGQTRLKVEVKAGSVTDLGANTNTVNKHGKLNTKDVQGFPNRFGTFTVGPVLTIPGDGYIAVVRDKVALGVDTMAATHLQATTLIVADKTVRAGIPDVQGWECMPDLGVLLGIEPFQDKEDRGELTRLAVTGGGGIIVKESPEQGNFGALELAKGSVGISEMMWAVDRSKLFGAASNVRQAQEQWIELHNLNSAAVHVTLFDLILDEAYTSNKYDELDRMGNFNSPTGGRWAIRTADFKRGRDGDSDYGRDFVAMQRADIPTAGKNYAHGDHNGTVEGEWKASTAVYLTRTSGLSGTFQLPYDQLNYDFIGTPARKNTLTAGGPGVTNRSNVPHSPVIFNEIANRTNTNRYYEWIELRNVTASEVNLRNYNISYITAVGTETTLYEFPNNDNIKIAAKSDNDINSGILLLTDTDPKNREDHPVAMDNPNVKYVVTDFIGNGLPDDGEFVLVLRHPEAADKAGTAKAKQGTDERVVDLIGYDPNLASAGIYSGLWPFKVFGAPLAHNKIDVETVHERQHVIDPDKATHGDKKPEHAALRDAGYSGIGYKRLIAGIPAHGGTPGYANNVTKVYEDANATVSAPVTISEIMYQTGNRLPQWIELYNSSKTEVVQLDDWTLMLENADDVSIRDPRVSVKLKAKRIQPNQTVLIVASSTGNHSDHFPDTRIIDIWRNGLKDKDRLEIASTVNRREFKFLSEKEFRITLKDKAGKVVDVAGNYGTEAMLPMPEEGEGRSSIIRRYDGGTARVGTLPVWGGPGTLNPAKDPKNAGMDGDAGWVLASASDLLESMELTYYGNVSDAGTPGYRGGGPVPVSLSKFRPERLDDGSIVVRWITDSELNNAGFNILRSETKDGEYTQLNTKLIAGQGTTSERTTYTYSDTSAKPNVVYYYQIQDVSLDGKVTTLRMSRLKGHISPAGKLSTKWAELKALQ